MRAVLVTDRLLGLRGCIVVRARILIGRTPKATHSPIDAVPEGSIIRYPPHESELRQSLWIGELPSDLREHTKCNIIATISKSRSGNKEGDSDEHGSLEQFSD